MSVARRRQMIGREHASLSIAAQCRLVSISRSSFYYAPVPEAAEVVALITVIDASSWTIPRIGAAKWHDTYAALAMRSAVGGCGA